MFPNQNPEVDYPCQRVFWETDEQYDRRKSRMDELSRQHKALNQRYIDISSVIDEERDLIRAQQRFLDMVYGFVQDDEFKSVLVSKNKVEARLAAHVSKKLEIFDEMKNVQKKLSELSR